MAKEMEENQKIINQESTLNPAEANEMVQSIQGLGKTAESVKGLARFVKTHTSLYIDDAGLKLMVVKGKQVIKWADLPLEPGMVADGVIASPETLAGKIKYLLRAQNVRGRKLITGFSGLHCLSRVITLPRLSGTVLDEAVKREVERELPVSLDNPYLAWQIVHTSDKELKVFVITYTRGIVDSLIKTLRLAGIKPYVMDLAPLALARAVNKKTAAIVDIRQTGLDIVVMVDGIPELIRSLPLAREKSLSDKLPVIREELERTIKFHLSNKTEASNQSNLPVFISGILLNDEALYRSFTGNLGFAVFPARPPLTYPAQIVPTHYTVNAGLILKSLPLNGEARLSLVNLNALPRTYAGKHFPVAPILYGLGTLVVVGVIVSGIVLVKNMNGQTQLLQAQLTTANQNLTQRMNLQKSLTDSVSSLEKNLNMSTPALAELNTTQASFVSQQDSINADLDLVVGKLSFNMTLTSIQYTSESLTVLGTAPSEAEVRDYAGVLESSRRYSEIIISRIVEDQQIKNTVDFTLILKEKG